MKVAQHFHGCFCSSNTSSLRTWISFNMSVFSTQGLNTNMLTHIMSSALLLCCSFCLHHLIICVCLPACCQYSVLQPCLQSFPLAICSVRARDPTPSHTCAGTATRTCLLVTTCAWTRYQSGHYPSSNGHPRDFRGTFHAHPSSGCKREKKKNS